MEVLQRTANRGSISDGGYEIDNSLKLERANSEKLARTPSSASNSKTWTYSFWLKRTQLGINSYHLEAKGTGDKFFIFGFNENDQILFYDIFSDDYGKAFTRRFRDTSAWYHIVLRADTTDGTASNRMRLYVNGVQETTVTSDYGDFPQNHDTQINKAVVHNIGYRTDINQYASGYMAETCLIDGTSLGPDSFGEFDSDTGIWKPIDVSGLTFGTNGFYQDYKTGADLGADKVSGGNSNDYTETNIAAADQATDTPTNNFCTLNVLDQRIDTPAVTTEGATVNVQDPGSGTGSVRGTMGASSGKWYWEFELDAFEGSSLYYLYGISSLDVTAEDGKYPGSSEDGGYSVGIYGQNGNVYYNGGSNTTFETNGPGADGDLIGVFLDLDNSTLRFAKNGTLIGNVSGTDAIARSSASLTGKNFWTASVADGTNSTALRTLFKMNFGGYTTISISTAQTDANGYGTFEYTPNDGTYDYYALCTKNLAEYG